MRLKLFLTVFALLTFVATSFVTAETEDEIVNRIMNRLEKKHTKKVAWLSGYFQVNRINRDNDYNKFASAESDQFTTTNLSWLGQSKAFGMDFGVMLNKRWGWSLGGEYWLKFGEELSGDQYYTPAAAVIADPKSELEVYGITTGVNYYLKNPPTPDGQMNKLSVRVGSTVGLYSVKWSLWDEYSYSNLNLATNTTTDGTITSFKDNAPGVSLNMGIDYPINFFDMVLGVDVNYLYLNFNQVAWYNTNNEEVVATYNSQSTGRVDLGLSGIRGKFEIKRFFSW